MSFIRSWIDRQADRHARNRYSSYRHSDEHREQLKHKYARRYRRGLIAFAVLTVLTIALVWYFRPIGLIHGPVMLLHKYPLLWFAPLLAFLAGAGITYLIRLPKARRARESHHAQIANLEDDLVKAEKDLELARIDSPDADASDYYGPLYKFTQAVETAGERLRHAQGLMRSEAPSPLKLPLIIGAALATLALIGAAVYAPMATNKAIYEHYSFSEISELPDGGAVRLMPKAVAEELASSGFNSSTENLKEGHIIRTPEGELAWSSERAPTGLVRTWTKKPAGIGLLDASRSSRDLELVDAEFELSPSIKLRDNLNWMAYKAHYLTDVAETTFILSGEGEPLLLAPYIGYEGFPVRVPVLEGVYVVHPDGTVEDLSPEEAAAREEIVSSGRLFPESLTRRIQESYKYKNGIWNRLFVHREQTEIADTEGNPQPYLMDFGSEGTKWVSTAEPYGRSYATNGIFLTDTVSGETDVWLAPSDLALTGNAKAIETVTSVSIPGVVFSGSGDAGGKFEAVEPRPVFLNGKLHFLVSIIPNSHNSVTKSVIVDASANKVVAVFNHDTDPGADEELISYLEKGQLDSELIDPVDPGEPVDPEAPTDPGTEVEGLSDAETAELLRQLRELQEQEREILDELEVRVGQ